jgi:hypothetical protein
MNMNKTPQKRIPDEVVVEIKMWRARLLGDEGRKWRTDSDFMKWATCTYKYLFASECQDHWKEIEAEHDRELGRK